MPIRSPVLVLALLTLLGGFGQPQPPDTVISVIGATEAQAGRLAEAVDRFASAGLELPPLAVEFSDEERDCGGRMGQFDSTAQPWQITICSPVDFVYEHELAHAWEMANLSDQDRRDFMVLCGHRSWANPEDSWMDRGVEGVAFIIQQGLLTQPLAHPLSREMSWRMELFEFLTGRPSPRLEQHRRRLFLPAERGAGASGWFPAPGGCGGARGVGVHVSRRSGLAVGPKAVVVR